MKQNLFKIKSKIDKIETTNDNLAGRGGILLFFSSFIRMKKKGQAKSATTISVARSILK